MSQWPSAYDYVLPTGPPGDVTLTVDGREVQAKTGDLLIKVAQDHGTYIPRFCYHERMKPVGMCRMCLVEVEGMRGLQISCATVVADGMVVHTQSDAARQAQDGVLELLLINHPLDCPVCDRGGECPLQDTTLAFGPGESRFVEEKRHWEKPIPISDLVLLDRERCIQCGRCTRFADEIAGDALITLRRARATTPRSSRSPTDPFTSYFSGNTVQICPVGALTATPYRFQARPWDLSAVETSCTTCAVHCRGALESSSNRLVRLLGVDSEPVNHGWLCDKGRFGYEVVHSEERVRQPDGPQGRRARRVLVARGARRRGRRRSATCARRSTARSPSRCSAARAARTRTRTCGRASPRASSAPTTSTRSSVTACPPSVALGLPRRDDRRTSTAPRRSSCSASTSRKSCRSSTCGSSAPRRSSASRSSSSHRRDQGLTRYADVVDPRTLPGRAGRHVAAELVDAHSAAPVRATRDVARRRGAARRARRRRRRRPRSGRPGRVGRRAPCARPPQLAELPQRQVPRRAAPRQRARRARPRARARVPARPGHARRRPRLVRATRGARCRRARGLDAVGILQAARAGPDRTRSMLLGTDPHDDCPDHALAASALNAARLHDRDRHVRHRQHEARRRLPPRHDVGRAGRQRHQPRGSRAARRPEGLARRHRDARLAHRRRARAAARRGLRPRAPPRRSRTRSRGSRRRSPASTRTLLRRARDGVGAADRRAPPTSSCSVRSRSRSPTRRGSRSSRAGRRCDSVGASRTRPKPRPSASRRRRRCRGRSAPTAGRRRPPRRAAAAPPALHRWRRRRRTTPRRPARDAYALRLVTGRTLYDGGITVGRVRLAGRARRRAGAARPPAGPRPHRRRRRRRGAGHVVPRLARRSPCAPTTPIVPGTAYLPVQPARAARSATLVDLRRGRHRPAGGVAVVMLARRSAASSDGVDLEVVLIVIGKTVVVFALLLVLVLFYIWFMRKVIADMQNRIGPRTRRTVRRAPDARRRHQAVLQGAVDPGPGRPASCSSSRRTSRCSRRSSRSRSSRSAARSRSPATRRTCSSPTRRSACCSCWRCRASGSTA